MIKTVIIEDEENNLQVLTALINEYANDLTICGTAGHVTDAIKLIESTSPDLVFMDIRLADGTSFDVLRKLSSTSFTLVIITAYDNYGLDAIKFSAVDYLLKPVGIPEFKEAVARAKKNLVLKTSQDRVETLLYNLGRSNNQDKKIGIATITGYEFVDLKDIIFCETSGPYTVFNLEKTKVMSSRNLGYFEEMLEKHDFCRIHNSVMVNIRYVKSYVKGKGGHLIMTNGKRFEVSIRRKGDLLSKLAL